MENGPERDPKMCWRKINKPARSSAEFSEAQGGMLRNGHPSSIKTKQYEHKILCAPRKTTLHDKKKPCSISWVDPGCPLAPISTWCRRVFTRRRCGGAVMTQSPVGAHLSLRMGGGRVMALEVWDDTPQCLKQTSKNCKFPTRKFPMGLASPPIARWSTSPSSFEGVSQGMSRWWWRSA